MKEKWQVLFKHSWKEMHIRDEERERNWHIEEKKLY